MGHITAGNDCVKDIFQAMDGNYGLRQLPGIAGGHCHLHAPAAVKCQKFPDAGLQGHFLHIFFPGHTIPVGFHLLQGVGNGKALLKIPGRLGKAHTLNTVL